MTANRIDWNCIVKRKTANDILYCGHWFDRISYNSVLLRAFFLSFFFKWSGMEWNINILTIALAIQLKWNKFFYFFRFVFLAFLSKPTKQQTSDVNLLTITFSPELGKNVIALIDLGSKEKSRLSDNGNGEMTNY